jgi:hypothetical protein
MVSKNSQTNCILLLLYFLITLSISKLHHPPWVNQSKESVPFRCGYHITSKDFQRLPLEEAAFRTTIEIKASEYSPKSYLGWSVAPLTQDEKWFEWSLFTLMPPLGRRSHRLSHHLAGVACREATSQSWPTGSRSTSHTSSSLPEAGPIYRDSPAICSMFFSSFANCIAA